MPPHDLQEVRIDVELLKKDITNILGVFVKLDKTIDNLEGISLSMTKLLTQQQERIEAHIKNDEDFEHRIERKITTLEEKFEKFGKEVKETSDSNRKEIMDELTKLKASMDKKPFDFIEMIKNIGTYKFLIFGGVLLFGWIFRNIETVTLFKGLFGIEK